MADKVPCKIRYRSWLDICPDETFTSHVANTHLSSFSKPISPGSTLRIGELDAKGAMMHYMAGYKRPTMTRLRSLMQDPTDMTGSEQHFYHELFAQLSPLQCREFMISSGGTPRQMAMFMRKTGTQRDVIVNWINSYSSDPNWKEIDMISITYGDKFTQLNDMTVLRRSVESIKKNLKESGHSLGR